MLLCTSLQLVTGRCIALVLLLLHCVRVFVVVAHSGACRPLTYLPKSADKAPGLFRIEVSACRRHLNPRADSGRASSLKRMHARLYNFEGAPSLPLSEQLVC